MTYLRFALGLGNRRPLQARGIAAAAAATQTTLDNGVNDFSGLHILNDAVEGSITSSLDIVLDPFRIDTAAVGSHNAHLSGEEGLFGITTRHLGGPSDQRIDNRGRTFRRNTLIHNAIGFDSYQRPLAAEPHASYTANLDAVAQLFVSNRFLQRYLDLVRPRGHASRRHAASNADLLASSSFIFRNPV